MASTPNDPDPSAQLLLKWQDDGDPDALNSLLQIEMGVLKQMIHGRVAAGLAGSASTSDVAQEAILGLLKTKAAPTFTDPKSLRGYLWRSAWHLLVKRYAKKPKVPLDFDIEASPGFDRVLRHAPALANIDRSERAIAIGVALGLLAHEDRELVRLVYFEEHDIAAAAATLGLTRGAASMRLVRARRLLASRLTEWARVIG